VADRGCVIGNTLAKLFVKQSRQFPTGADDCSHMSLMLGFCSQIMREHVGVPQND
jgi:hypothetical protein